MIKKVLDYDGNWLFRLFKFFWCRIFEKIIIKYNCFKFKYLNNCYRKKNCYIFWKCSKLDVKII